MDPTSVVPQTQQDERMLALKERESLFQSFPNAQEAFLI
jgi:hypothetical protein